MASKSDNISTTTMQIRDEVIFDTPVVDLLQQHLDNMKHQSPPESVHALDIESLKQRDVSFWTVWEGADLLGCGALKELSASEGEIKSMCTHEKHKKKGVATAILKHIIMTSENRGYARLSLETGSMESFETARRLYTRFGFTVCEPFAQYQLDPNSVFMTIAINIKHE